MYLNKITLALLVIYIIINAVYVIDLNNRVEIIATKQHVIKKQSNATTMLLLTHVDLDNLERKYNLGEKKNKQYNIYPQINYD
jgi:hypothetical protein